MLLRFVGIMNAAIWLGTAVALWGGVKPAFDSGEMLRILPVAHAGAAEQVLAQQMVWLQYWCAGIAVAHALIEWLYAGRLLRRLGTAVLLALLVLVVLEGEWIGPKLEQSHLDVYGLRSSPAQREMGRRQHALWDTTAQVINLLVSVGLVVYVWSVIPPGGSARFPGNKFWG